MFSLLAMLRATFRSRLALQMEVFSLRHQLALYKAAEQRPRIRPVDRLLWAWLSRATAATSTTRTTGQLV